MTLTGKSHRTSNVSLMLVKGQETVSICPIKSFYSGFQKGWLCGDFHPYLRSHSFWKPDFRTKNCFVERQENVKIIVFS